MNTARLRLHGAHTVAMALAALVALIAQSAHGWPLRPVRIVVPQSPGGSTDMMARLLAARLTEGLGQTVVIDNRPGAGSLIGTEVAVRANPDGYTTLVVSSSITINPSLHAKLAFNPLRDLAPITQLSAFPNVLVVHPAVPAKTVQELATLARAKPGQINYGSAGAGTGTHLSAELFKSLAAVDIQHVAYKGGGPSVGALLAGEVQLSFATLPSVLLHIRSGKLRALGVTTTRRSFALPDVPTIAEGGIAGYEHVQWTGFLAPTGTPAPIIARLNTEAVRAVHSAEVKPVLANEGAEPVGNSPQAFAAILKSETERIARVIRQAGIGAVCARQPRGVGPQPTGGDRRKRAGSLADRAMVESALRRGGEHASPTARGPGRRLGIDVSERALSPTARWSSRHLGAEASTR
ncbi:MAG: tripartite tricarboxylate transporter substrate binding protein [Proteobacteria bacterium]|nr:tripartite tricarboxylate transporter substrate binding protein [Burkholderiales bacterium]